MYGLIATLTIAIAYRRTSGHAPHTPGVSYGLFGALRMRLRDATEKMTASRRVLRVRQGVRNESLGYLSSATAEIGGAEA